MLFSLFIFAISTEDNKNCWIIICLYWTFIRVLCLVHIFTKDLIQSNVQSTLPFFCPFLLQQYIIDVNVLYILKSLVEIEQKRTFEKSKYLLRHYGYVPIWWYIKLRVRAFIHREYIANIVKKNDWSHTNWQKIYINMIYS